MAGHMKSPRGPHAARGPRVGQHCSIVSVLDVIKTHWLSAEMETEIQCKQSVIFH